MDCVPAALASMARGLNPALAGKITGDGLHDAVYGQGYVGLMDPARFVGILAQQFGMRLVGPITGSAQALYGRACSEVAAGHPVLMSIPSDWNGNPPTSGFAQMVAGCDVQNNGASATAMNSWLDDYQTETAAWWIERFDRCAYKALWFVERMAEVEVASVWHKQADGSGKDDVGHVCGGGIMLYLEAHGLTGSDGLLSETYYEGPKCALPLASGRIVTAKPDGHGGWVMDEEGAQAFVSVWGQLGAANAKIGQLDAQLKQAGSGSGDNPAYKAAVDALRVALAADLVRVGHKRLSSLEEWLGAAPQVTAGLELMQERQLVDQHRSQDVALGRD